MMKSRATSAEEAPDRRIFARGLEQLDSGVTELEEGESHLLRFDVLLPGIGASEKLREDADRGVQVVDGDRDVVEADFTVHREPGVPKRCSYVRCSSSPDYGHRRERRDYYIIVEDDREMRDWHPTLRSRVSGPARGIFIWDLGDVMTAVKPIEVTDDNFNDEVAQSEGLAIVDFWAAWCGPCRIVAPILEELAQQYAGQLKVAKLDVDSNQKTAMQFNIRSIPTILFFKDGEHVDTVIGAVPKPNLEQKIKEHLG